MLSSYLLALFFAAAAAACLRLLPPLHPLQLWCLAWAAATALFCMRLLPVVPITSAAAALVVAATICFGAGTLLAAPAFERFAGGARRWEAGWSTLQLAAAMALLLLGVALAIHLGPLVREFGLWSTLSSSNELKGTSLVSDNPRYLYFAIAAVPLAALAAARAPGPREARIWGALCASAAASPYFASARAAIIYLVLVAGLAYLLGRPRPPDPRRLLVAAGAFVAVIVTVMIAVGLLQDRGITTSSDVGSVPSVFHDEPVLGQLGVPYGYAVLPLAALGEQVRVSSSFGHADGCASLRVACSALQRTGLPFDPVDPARPFTSQPIRWNLYTSLDLPLVDGGIVLAPLILGLTGFVLGLLWQAIRRGTLLGLIGYPLFGASCFYATTKYEFSSQYQVGALIIALLLVAAAGVLASSLESKGGRFART